MPMVVLKLFAGQGSWMDGQSGDSMLPPLESINIESLMTYWHFII